MNYYVRTQQVLAANAAINSRRMAQLNGLHAFAQSLDHRSLIRGDVPIRRRVRLFSGLGQQEQFPSTPPTDQENYVLGCPQPLPPNTTIEAIVPVDANTSDFYYHQAAQPGSILPAWLRPDNRWVCRRGTTPPSVPGAAVSVPSATAGQPLSPVVAINPTANEVQPGPLWSAANAVPSGFDALSNWVEENWGWGLAALTVGGLILAKEVL